jgi:putative membrane protein
VIGDRGIHERCGPGFWSAVAQAVSEDFHAGRFTDGIVKGVARAGDVLAQHFPRAADRPDVNELPDRVSED